MRHWRAVLIGVLAWAFLGAVLLTYYQKQQPPPACAEDIAPDIAKQMLVPMITEKMRIPRQDAETFKVVAVARDSTEEWPTYVLVFEGWSQGKARQFQAFGNGCGISELADLSGNLDQIEPVSSIQHIIP